ncbi:MAG: hypothetical protein Q7R49_01550 [Candidatus Daviesbacteria bacterium]|nr:hypothetical protein [Candidatus Daviesbacteria bacterium]
MESNPVPPQPASESVPPAQAPVIPAAPVTPQPVPQPNPNVVTDEKTTGGSKKMLWIILILVALALLGGGYFLMNRKPAEVPVVSTSINTSDLDALSTELGSTQTGTENLSTDLTALDKDLAGL